MEKQKTNYRQVDRKKNEKTNEGDEQTNEKFRSTHTNLRRHPRNAGIRPA